MLGYSASSTLIMTTTMQSTITQLTDGISVIDAHYVKPGIASIYLMTHDSKVSIIETGTAHSIPYVMSALEELGFTKDDVEYVIPTHIHLDHAAGAGELIDLCPNAQLVIHPRGAAHMINPEKLEAGTMAVYGEEKYRALYGALKPIPEERVIVADDNFELDFNGRTLRFIDTPGHALHHFCIYDSLSNGIFTGDSFGLAYKELRSSQGEFLFATTTPVHFDPDAMLNTIERLLSFNPKAMYLTHFGAIKPTAANVDLLTRSVQAFVAIAMQEKDQEEGRMERMEASIMEWLLTELAKTDCPYPEADRRKLLQGDCHLNAQGLDVWLHRIKKFQSS